MNASPPTASASGGTTDQPLANPAVIPEPTRRRKLNIQTAARLYIYGGETNLAEIARQVGCSHRNLCEIRHADGWDEFAARVWAEANGATGLSIRTPAQEALIIQQSDRQQKQIPKLTGEIERVLEAMVAEQPGSKLHSAMVASLGKLEAMVERASGMDLAKTELVARIKAATLGKGIAQPPGEAPATGSRHGSKPTGSEGRIVDVEPTDTPSQSTAPIQRREGENGESGEGESKSGEVTGEVEHQHQHQQVAEGMSA